MESDIPMQILVSAGGVQVYTGAIDLMPCTCQALAFPAVGTCSFLTDAGPCDGNPSCHSCLTDFGVEVDGVRLAPTGYGGTDPHALYYGTFPSGQLALVLAGCGRGTWRIPLDGPALPSPTVQATYVNGVPTVAWATDVPAQNAMLTLSSGTHGELCLVQNVEEYSFQGWGPPQSVSVQTFGAPTEMQTAFGMATIWRGGASGATFPP
jgi:hypothetical protein